MQTFYFYNLNGIPGKKKLCVYFHISTNYKVLYPKLIKCYYFVE